MKTIDPGHRYLLDSYDGGEPVPLVFVKREGEGYPFNVGHHPGTNCQEVIRTLIDRVKYLQKQIACDENQRIINNLRSCLWEFEGRAAKRHGRASVFPWQEQYQPVPIEEQPTCPDCGHVGCEGQHRSTAAPAPPVAQASDNETQPSTCANCSQPLIKDAAGDFAHAATGAYECEATATPTTAAVEDDRLRQRIEQVIAKQRRARTHEPKYCCPEDEAFYDRQLVQWLVEELGDSSRYLPT